MEASVADLAQQPGATDEDQEPAIGGSVRQLTLDVGGHKVTESEFKLKGGSVAVEGQFKKGETVLLLVRATVGKVEFQDKTDHTENVVATVRRHVATIESVERQGVSGEAK